MKLTWKEREARRGMTEDELKATAAVMGMEYIPVENSIGILRERLGPSYAGCAYFCYRNAISLKPIVGMEKLSQLDQPYRGTGVKPAAIHAAKKSKRPEIR
jgi:hypothetical protein